MSMKQYHDGGEAIMEAFRTLGIDYIISSPGSEWSPVWEAVARQKVNQKQGPQYIDCWHETLAVDMAMGYTQMTGRCQAVLLHAGAGLLQGTAGMHSAVLAEVPMVIMSGKSLTFGENPALDIEGQWYRSLSIVGGPQRLVEPVTKWATPGDERVDALRERHARRRIRAAHAQRPGLSQRAARDHAAPNGGRPPSGARSRPCPRPRPSPPMSSASPRSSPRRRTR